MVNAEQSKIVIRKHRTADDDARAVRDSVAIKNAQGEPLTNRHPIWTFNPAYAREVIFKMETIQALNSRAAVIQAVGYPLLAGALHLFDLGITTVDSSPHAYPGFLKNTPADHFYAYIDLDAQTLNNANTVVAERLVAAGQAEKLDVAYHMWEDEAPLWAYRLLFPIDSQTTAEQMSAQVLQTAQQFAGNG